MSSLLPGLRDLRAPLAAGYVWLFSLYMMLEPVVPSRAEADGAWASVLALHDLAGPVGVGIAATFLAYLVGSISEAMFVAVARVLARWLGWGTSPYYERGDARLGVDRWRLTRFARFVGRHTSLLSPRSIKAVHALALAKLDPVRAELERVGTSLERLNGAGADRSGEPALSESEREFGDAIWRVMPQWQTLTAEALAAPEDDPKEPVWPRVVSQFEARLVSEFDLARTTLLGREAELFSAIDRLRSEGYLRTALVLPLGGLAAVLGWRAGWSAAFLVAVATAVLFAQAILRVRQSNDALIEALRLDRAQAPVLAQLERLVEDLPRAADRVQQKRALPRHQREVPRPGG